MVERWVGRLLEFAPSTWSGSVRAEGARRVAARWRKRGPESAAGAGMSLLLRWGAQRPIAFSGAAGAFSAVLGWLVVVVGAHWLAQSSIEADLPTDRAAFFGVPWGVQATLVALVFPVVISFVALMLQRRAHASMSLRVYALESGVVPAGSSSIALLLVLGAFYYLSGVVPGVSASWVWMAVAVSAVWGTLNILLTALFLGGTLRFLREEAQRSVVQRLAVGPLLKGELVVGHAGLALRERISNWNVSATGAGIAAPKFSLVQPWRGVAFSIRVLARGWSVADVHLRPLYWASKRWRQRAVAAGDSDASLAIPVSLGSKDVVPVAVATGGELTRAEAFAARSSVALRRAEESHGLSTLAMLDEMRSECRSHMEAGRADLAVGLLDEQLRLHQELLATCAQLLQADATPEGQEAAAWLSVVAGLNTAWTRSYFELADVAVQHGDDGLPLLRRLAYVSTALVLASPPRQAVLETSLLPCQLAIWALANARARDLAPGDDAAGAVPSIEQPYYERALLSVLGAWNAIPLNLGISGERSDQDHWLRLQAIAGVGMAQLEGTALFMLDAMLVGDEVGAKRWCDLFLKWSGAGTAQDRYLVPNLARPSSPDLLVQPWDDARHWLAARVAQEPESLSSGLLEAGLSEMELLSSEYWDALRVFLVLTLLEQSQRSVGASALRNEIVGALVRGGRIFAGGHVSAQPLEANGVAAAYITCFFGSNVFVGRIRDFTREVTKLSREPRVAGFVYVGFGGTSANSLLPSLAKLLATVQAYQSYVELPLKKVDLHHSDAGELAALSHCWRDIEERVKKPTAEFTQAAKELAEVLSQKQKREPAYAMVAKISSVLAENAERWSRVIDRCIVVEGDDIARFVTRLAKDAFAGEVGGPHEYLGRKVCFSNAPLGETQAYSFEIPKSTLVEGEIGTLDDWVTNVGQAVRDEAIARAFAKLVKESPSFEVAGSRELKHDGPVPAIEDFLLAVREACRSVSERGLTPFIIGSSFELRQVFWSHTWEASLGGRRLPEGMTMEDAQAWQHLGPCTLFNGVPYFDSHAAGGACFVVPFESIQTLLVRGDDAASAVDYDWEVAGEASVQVTVRWRAGFDA